MNFRDISQPVLILGILCFLLNLSVSLFIGPKSGIWLKNEIESVITARLPMAIEEGTFNTSFRDVVIMIKEKPSQETFKGIFIYDGRKKNEPKVMVAKDGEIHTSEGLNTNLLLKNGFVHIAQEDSTTELFFNRYNMALRLESGLPSKKNTELTPFELIEEIKERPQQDSSLQLELHRRLSLPLLCLILTFLGPPLSLMAGKAGRLGGLSVGLGVFTAYYILLMYGENLVRAAKIPHYVGAWTPTIVLGIFSLWVFKRESAK